MIPVVSILMSSYRSEFMADAVASVFAQTRQDYQLLIDFTPDAPFAARLNRLAEIAVGKWLVILCDDDWLTTDFLAVVLREADAHPSAEVVYSDASVFTHPTGQLQRANMKRWSFDGFRDGPACWITALVRRDLWHTIGGHDPTLAWSDYDFWYRCFKAGAPAHHVRQPLWLYRAHAGQWSHRIQPDTERAAIEAKHPELSRTNTGV